MDAEYVPPKEVKLSQDQEDWKRRYQSLVLAHHRLQGQMTAQSTKMVALAQNLVHAQQALDLQKQIVRDAIGEHNKKEQAYVELINKLKAKLRELGYADFNRLGD